MHESRDESVKTFPFETARATHASSARDRSVLELIHPKLPWLGAAPSPMGRAASGRQPAGRKTRHGHAAVTARPVSPKSPPRRLPRTLRCQPTPLPDVWHPTARDPAHAQTVRPGPSCPLGRSGTSGGHEADPRSSRWQGGSYPAGAGPVGPMPLAQPLCERRSDEQLTMGDLRYETYQRGPADESMPVYGPDDRGSRAIPH